MSEIKLINKDTDLSKINVRKVDWDAYCGKQPLDVYSVPGFVHSIGGRWGNNEYWCVSRGLEFKYENGIHEFAGHACNWSFEIKYNNYFRSKWGESEIRQNYSCVIKRNGKDFYTLNGNSESYLLAKAHLLLIEIHEHAIPFHFQNYEKEIVGREIEWNNIPMIIETYSLNNNLILVPDEKNISMVQFSKITKNRFRDNDNIIIDNLFSSYINWFRLNSIDWSDSK